MKRMILWNLEVSLEFDTKFHNHKIHTAIETTRIAQVDPQSTPFKHCHPDDGKQTFKKKSVFPTKPCDGMFVQLCTNLQLPSAAYYIYNKSQGPTKALFQRKIMVHNPAEASCPGA